MLAGFANWLLRQAKSAWGWLLRQIQWISGKAAWLVGQVRHRKVAAVLSALAVIVLIGAAQAGGPMGAHAGGRWGHQWWRWWVRQPVPTMTIVAVVEDTSVTFTTKNLPENQNFQVLIGKMWTRGVGGTAVGSFNSSDGVIERIYRIPPDVRGDERIAIRITTDHAHPYYAFNWFFNNSTNGSSTSTVTETESAESTAVSTETDAESSSAAESEPQTSTETASSETEQTVLAVEQPMHPPMEKEKVPSFRICAVDQNNTVLIQLRDFPTKEVFKVQMGVMPEYPAAEPYYDGRMKWMGKDEKQTKGRPMPPMPPMDDQTIMQPPLQWIPYYDAGFLEIGQEAPEFAEFKIPPQLTGSYRISILLRTRHAFPYYSYNWFYNNDAVVCEIRP